MTQPHLQPRTEQSKVDRLLAIVQARLGTILAFAFLLVAGALYVGFEPQISREMKVVGYSFAFLTPYGYIVGKKVIDWLYNPEFIYLVDLDARYLDGALYELPFADFGKLETRAGEMTQLTPNLYVAKDVDLDHLEATGTWRGTLPDTDLARQLQNVHDCRGDLEEQARRGFIWETSGRIIIRNAVRDNLRTIIEMFDSGTLPDKGESLNRQVQKQLDDWEIEDTIESTLDDTDQTPDPKLSEEAQKALLDLESELAEQVETEQSSTEAPGDD